LISAPIPSPNSEQKDIQPKASAGFKPTDWKSILAKMVADKISKVSRNTRNQAIIRKNRKAAKIATRKVLAFDLKKI
jgi:hypothetical protein